MITAILLRCEGCGRRVPTVLRNGAPVERPRCAACAVVPPMGATWG